MWYATKAIFKPDSDIDYESLGIVNNEVEYEDFRFNFNEVIAYNKASDNKTTVWFRGSNTITIDVDYDEFDEEFIGYINFRDIR